MHVCACVFDLELVLYRDHTRPAPALDREVCVCLCVCVRVRVRVWVDGWVGPWFAQKKHRPAS